MVNQLQPDVFWQALEQVAQPSLLAIFGPELRFGGNTAMINQYHGSASLGCLRLAVPIELLTYAGRVRARFYADGRWLSLAVTDVRLHDAAFASHTQRIAELAQRLKRGSSTILSVGLTRPWKKDGDDAAYHWLQVNNVFVGDEPFLAVHD